METELIEKLSSLPLGGVRFFTQTGSTNDVALAWAAEGAPDFSLVVAEEQTSGRGRMGRSWFTPPGAALALSLIIRPVAAEKENIALFSGLGALGLLDVLGSLGIAAQIKWPNDVLIRRRKVAGILAETVWMGAEADSVVLGMGINVFPASVPPPENLNFPATCIQSEYAAPVDRLDLLKRLLEAILRRRASLGSPEFIRAWESALAFRGETVQVWQGDADPLHGQIEGLETDGSLRLRVSDWEIRAIRFGEVHLRPV